MDEYISKPVREENLFRLIQRFVPVTKPPANRPAEHAKATGPYHYINLDYMKEVSAGNTEYEKAVTGQFLEAIPGELQALEQAWQQQDGETMRQVAHNMKTTISVMGLNSLLGADLDSIENPGNDHHVSGDRIDTVISVCRMALVEARHFLANL
jgi:hypothetical protein